MSRRQWGSVRKLPSGQYQARTGGSNPVPAPRTFNSSRAASRWLADARKLVEDGNFVDHRPAASMTVAEWMERWLSEFSVGLRQSTIDVRRSLVRTQILPDIGSITLGDLKRVHVQQLINAKAAELAPSTTSSILVALSSAMRTAVDIDLLVRSPTRGVKPPPIPRTEVVVLDDPALDHLLDQLDEPYHTMVYVTALCGLRFGEVTGLRVGRVDMLGRRLLILETSSDRGPERSEPKTEAGRRSVPMPGFIVDHLAAHLARAGLTAVEADTRVVRGAGGGRMWQQTFRRHWVPARQAAGYPTLRFHDLRHSAVPRWIDAGASLEQVSDWLGHANINITKRLYWHLWPNSNDNVMAALDERHAARASR